MAVKRKRARDHVLKTLATLIKGIRSLKDQLTGSKWRRAHRIESELETLAGTKAPVKRLSPTQVKEAARRAREKQKAADKRAAMKV